MEGHYRVLLGHCDHHCGLAVLRLSHRDVRHLEAFCSIFAECASFLEDDGARCSNGAQHVATFVSMQLDQWSTPTTSVRAWNSLADTNIIKTYVVFFYQQWSLNLKVGISFNLANALPFSKPLAGRLGIKRDRWHFVPNSVQGGKVWRTCPASALICCYEVGKIHDSFQSFNCKHIGRPTSVDVSVWYPTYTIHVHK